MPNDSDEVVVGANGSIRAAPVGTAAPVDAAAAFSATWIEVGFASEDGATFRDSKTMQAIPAWQSFYPVRRLISERDAQVEVALRQWNDYNLPLAFGGGAVTLVSAGQYKYTPPAPETLDSRALALEWIDGTKKYRLIIPKGISMETVETQFARTQASDLPLTFGVTPDDGVNPWYLLTNDPAFAP